MKNSFSGAGGAAGYTAQTYGAPGAVGSGASAYATNTGTAGYGAVSQNKVRRVCLVFFTKKKSGQYPDF